MRFLPFLLMLGPLAAAPAFAADDDRLGAPNFQSNGGYWGFDGRITSAALARDGWKFLSLSTLSWPDGRQAVVTLWQSKIGDYARCFDYYLATMEPNGGKCERSGTGL